MATFATLLEEKRLIRVTAPLHRTQFHERKLYAFPDCLEWMRKKVPEMKTGRANAAATPHQQLIVLLRQWMAGEAMAYGPVFHDLTPRENGVWELKSHDLRIFGWMYRPREFIAARGGYTDDFKEPTKIKTYGDERRAVEKMRDDLPLDGDKFVLGDFDDLV